jgi:hypothetical protein
LHVRKGRTRSSENIRYEGQLFFALFQATNFVGFCESRHRKERTLSFGKSLQIATYEVLLLEGVHEKFKEPPESCMFTFCSMKTGKKEKRKEGKFNLLSSSSRAAL